MQIPTYLYRYGALGFVALGVVGMFVPLLPTVIFWIIAAALYVRSDKRRAIWLFRQPGVGPIIENFVRYGVMERSAKRSALIGISIAGVIGVVLTYHRPWIVLIEIIGLGVAAIYVSTRPESRLK